ncbi:hypothetical protein [Acidicapsa acidisoli]|uniref:hypothetical protein n=1 Tax=Acidicapsa acidisoli TaxID=1615681 RepID=UPI0021E0B680|nr:hypothetical protein [Acidicapsa acidisoli]
MNRLKALPWTQILLFCLLLTNLVNYVQMERLKRSVDDVWSQLQDQASAGQMDDIEKQIKESNEHLQEVEFGLRCMSSRFDATCIAAGRSRLSPIAP